MTGVRVKAQAVRRAAALVGGPRRLRDRLGVSSAEIAAWLAGHEDPPEAVFLSIVEIILDAADPPPARD